MFITLVWDQALVRVLDDGTLSSGAIWDMGNYIQLCSV